MTTDDPRELVRRAAGRYPYFARKYAGLDLAGDFDLADVPEMTREDVTASAMEATRLVPRPTGAFLFTSGGSTAEPKIAWIPCEMHLTALLPHWRPLGPDDVFANLAMPGRLWSAHYFYNRVAERCGADVIGLGHVPEEELAQWLDFLYRHGTTALAGTPSQLASVLRTGHPLLGQLRAAIFFGEACEPELPRLRDEVAPRLGFWGNYGSTETWVIGHNGPDCAVDTFHVAPYQHVEIVDGAVLVTTLHETAVSPVIRYRIGDRAEPADCACGRTGQTIRVLGREGALVKFAGTLVSPQELVELARAVPGVRGAQAALFAEGPAEILEIRVLGAADPEAVRERLLDSQIDLRFALRGEEETFRVRLADRLETNPRTAKTPALVRP